MNDIKSKYSIEERKLIIDSYMNGKSVFGIVSDTGISRSTLYSWIKQYQEAQMNGKMKITVRNFRTLENKVKRLEGIIEIIRRSECSSTASLNEKLQALEKLYGQYSVHMLCDALNVSRGTFYNHMLRNKRNNTWYNKRREELRIKIQEIYDDSNQIFGAEKIAAVLKSQGYKVSIDMVRELMHDMGLISIRQEAKSFYDRHTRKYRDYVNQKFHTDKPNQIWVSDVTFFRFNNKAYYICVVIDLFSRKVVGYKIGKNNSTQLVKATFKQAYKARNPDDGLIFHTDRGTNYRSKAFCECLKSVKVKQSFSRAHVPYDNSVMESFFSSMKREELYRTKYRSESDFKKAVEKYITFYNTKRPHAKLHYKTPEQAECDYVNSHAKK